jgi:hypothetical protein
MSAETPPTPESGPHVPESPTPSPETVALRNTVPPTPEAPAAQIVEVRDRLSQRGAVNQTTPGAQPTHTPTPIVTSQGPFARIASGAGNAIVRGAKAGGGWLYGFFGYIFVHMIWHGLTHLPAFGGGGGGGGHSKPSGGGGGGHH